MILNSVLYDQFLLGMPQTPQIAEHTLTLETARFGPFTFQVGVDADAIETPFLRVSDAHQRLQGSPLAQVASRLEREVVATSVFGTNSIEGGSATCTDYASKGP